MLTVMMRKTTVYLPDDLKSAMASEAERRGVSEAQFIRSAISAAVARPLPRAGLFEAEPFAERVDEHLRGFGER